MAQQNGLLATLNRKRANLTAAVRTSRRQDGVCAAVRLTARWTAEGALRPVTALRQRRFDRRLGVETRLCDVPDAEAVAAARFVDSNAYTPAPAAQFARMLRALPIGTPADYTFVDLGCGKGLTMLLAAQHGFGSVRGVELDRRLAAVAERNVRSFVAGRPGYAGVMSVSVGDAADHPLPGGPTVVFLFNPFGGDTLRAAARTMQRSLASSPRPFFVAYYHPLHRAILDELPFLRPLRRTTRWAIYEGRRPG